jgi:predicted transcriptional regulator
MGMAAAALYIACLQNNEKITQKDIAEAAGVTEVTVRNRYKALKKQLNLETPNQKACFQPFLFSVSKNSIEMSVEDKGQIYKGE